MVVTRLFSARVATIPAFLAPSIFVPEVAAAQHSFAFSTSTSRQHRDRNRQRGVSALRRTGPKFPLTVSNQPLPQPVLDPAKRSKVPVREDHGLWQFFSSDKKAMVLPEVEAAHGRAWTVGELRVKSFEDLHSLWWVCVKERNRIATQEFERRRVKAGYGQAEAEDRDQIVKKTQKAIKQALTERWYAYTDAKQYLEGTDMDLDEFEDEEEVLEEDFKEAPEVIEPRQATAPMEPQVSGQDNRQTIPSPSSQSDATPADRRL